jgi:ABC-type Fe3+-hydroxamate transport system substrate-binding protein
MPGTFTSIFVAAFDLDERKQPVPAFAPRRVVSEEAALEEARELALEHAGVLVWKRTGDPVVGEEGDPEIIFREGRTGDFY